MAPTPSGDAATEKGRRPYEVANRSFKELLHLAWNCRVNVKSHQAAVAWSHFKVGQPRTVPIQGSLCVMFS